MSRLTCLRIARWVKGNRADLEYPNLETLVDEEAVKVTDGYHQARWIAPLVGLFFSLACFLPLAMTVHPLFWIGVAGINVLGLGLGAVFHALALRISPSQLTLRKRCILIANRLISARNLLGVAPVISPSVAAVLDEGAKVYLKARPNSERDARCQGSDAWSEAKAKAQLALDEGMAQLLTLAEPDSVAAQEALLEQGWAGPLLSEMRATATALSNQDLAAQLSGDRLHPAASSLTELADARAHLERLGIALRELDDDGVLERRQGG